MTLLHFARHILIVASLAALNATALAADSDWAKVVSQASESVVSLQLANLRNFDDTEQGGSSATGFVVDAEMGIVLTNRHVVGSGPIRFSATFQNQEQVDAVPLYRDPIHDFAFVRYNPEDLQYAKPYSLPLRPDKVSTGLNIRVIGSDGGEQLSILTGTIARLDREVPSYGRYGYNDFNTFYFQAASSTSGGSSGSPVIDIDGDVVALNAAANTKTASSFFLPLPRIQYALDRLRKNEPIDRGGLQTIFTMQSYRDLTRLGLDAETEAAARAHQPEGNGMLMVSQVIAGGVAEDLLEEGDILISIDNQLIGDFIELEALLDSRIGQTLDITVIRQGEKISVQSGVADLHALAPNRLIEFGDAILQNMSIQHARAMNRAQSGVVVMRPGYFFDKAGIAQSSVITEVNGQPVKNIDEFVELVKASPRDKKLLARFIVPGREYTTRLAQFDIDNRWFDFRSCSRVDDVRFWDCEPFNVPEKITSAPLNDVTVPMFKDELLGKVAPAIVRVDFNIPYSVDNVYARNFKGVGLIVDKQEGLVVVDRNTVPVGLGDVEITFFGSQLLTGSVVFLHPRHNIALLKYDPAELGDAVFDEIELVDNDGAAPKNLTMIGYRSDGTFRRHLVDEFSRLTVSFGAPGLARFQQAPADLFGVSDVPPSLGGPFVDEQGRAYGMYMSFAYEESREVRQKEWSMPAAIIKESIRMYRSNSPFYSLDARLGYRSIAQARQLGLPESWLDQFNALPSDSRRVIYIEQVVPNTDAENKLLPGDILLAINAQLVANLWNAEINSQFEQVQLTLLRSGAVIDVTVTPSVLSGLGTQRLVSWAGAYFQEAHQAIAYQKGVDFAGVYIANTEQGSPALWDGLYRNRFVTEVDGQSVENLDEFLDLVLKKSQDEITRLSLVTVSGRKGIVTVAPEYNFWPTFEISRDNDQWRRINY